ncbi:hypothetical protein, partial [Fluviicola sp.]|uniref:hypothetical protein n=1 Tax=Fluviicola sp. TaxID=1917219 RepID=UPI00282AD5C8
MKKLLFFAACGLSFGLNAQSPGVSSILRPSRSSGYIYWEEVSGVNFKVNVYRLVNGRYQLISSDGTKNHYFRFNSAQLLSSDLFYTIAVYDPTGVLVSEGEPAAINPDLLPPSSVCSMDCNGLRESYRLHWMINNNTGAHFLMASEATYNAVTGAFEPYYQAIDSINYSQLDPQHPYLEPGRDRIPIASGQIPTGAGPFYDAQHNPVTNGVLVEKKMDKFMHFNHANTGAYESSNDWCEANIGTGTSIFNGHVDQATVAPANPLTSDLGWFLPQTGTDSQGNPIYVVPDKLSCSTMQGGSSGDGFNTEYGSLMDFMVDCFETSEEPLQMIDCIEGGDPGNGFHGFTFESVDQKEGGYSLCVSNDNGTLTPTGTSGKFTPGLYRINLFFEGERIIPVYRVLGIPETRRVVDVSISPNVIVGSVLRFGITASQDTPVQILVQKLDGTTV